MKTIGIICEYNPFHNGHKFQIEKHKKELGADGVIAVMSGNFVQRGAPAICDKWQRTKMALSSGCDLVIELPTVFATQSAERFARGGVELIDGLGICDYISFGSECEDIEKLKDCAKYIESDDVKTKTAELLKSGMSYPAARAEAVAKEYAEILKEPNNILAIEYIKALTRIKSKVKPVCIKREGAAHDSDIAKGFFASASFVRKCIAEGKDYADFVPKSTKDTLNESDIFCDTSALDGAITYLLRTKTPEELETISDMAEGLEYRFIEAARECASFGEISQKVKTKRYTKTRIDRILISTLLGITKEDVSQKPQYIRALGFNEKGKEILSEIKKKSNLPIITKTKDASLSQAGEKMLKKDIYATDIYSALCTNKKSGLDYTMSPIIIK